MVNTQIKVHRYGVGSVCYLKEKAGKSDQLTLSDSAALRTEIRMTHAQGYTAFFLLKKSFLKDYMKLEMQVWKLQRISTGHILQWAEKGAPFKSHGNLKETIAMFK